MDYQHIRVEQDGHLTVVTINRPDSLNALHPATTLELQAAWDSFQEDPQQWVGILTGAGDRAFSAGNDLKYQAFHGSMKMRDELRDLHSGFGGITARENLIKPCLLYTSPSPRD